MRRNYVTLPLSRFFNQFVVSPFRSFIVLVLDELGYSAYEIGLAIALADVSALIGVLIGASLSDHIGRKYSSGIGRSIYALGMLLMYLFFYDKPLFLSAFALSQIGLMRARSASYVLAGETSSNRVSFGAYSLAINDIGGFLGLLLFVKALDGKEAVDIFREFILLRVLFASLSALMMFISEETRSGPRGRISIDKRLLRYLLLILFAFIGVAIFRTFSPLYAKKVIGIPDILRGKISMIRIAIEGIFYFSLSRMSLSSKLSASIGVASYVSLALSVVIFPTRMVAIFAFGVLAPGFTAFFRPAMMDFDISLTDPKARGRLISIIFLFRRIGLTIGRISGARLFLIEPMLVMLAPILFLIVGLIGILKTF